MYYPVNIILQARPWQQVTKYKWLHNIALIDIKTVDETIREGNSSINNNALELLRYT